MAVIVEVRRKGGQLIERCRVANGEINVGRGFGNDVIIDDMMVSPEHLSLVPCEGAWRVIDRDSLNGYHITGHGAKKGILLPGQKLRIGQVFIQVYPDTYQVAPTQKSHPLERRIKQLGRHTVWPVLLFFSLGVHLLLYWGEMQRELKFLDVINLFKNELFSLTVIAFGWALAERVFRHHVRFFSYLSLWALYAAITALGKELAMVVSYNTGSDLWRLAFDVMTNLVVLTLVLWASLTLSTNLGRRGRVWVASCVSIAFIVLQFFDVVRSYDMRHFFPAYNATIRVPALQFADSQPASKTSELLDQLLDQAEKAVVTEEQQY